MSMSTPGKGIFHALIKTHHMTSRRKIALVEKHAQDELDYAVIRTGRTPGLMYGEGTEGGVENWVRAVKKLRYKDYFLLRRPALIQLDEDVSEPRDVTANFVEVTSIHAFSDCLQQRGVFKWYRDAMGFSSDPLGSPSSHE